MLNFERKQEVYVIICIVFGVDWPYAGRTDRDSSSASQNVVAEPLNHSKKGAKVGRHSGLLARFFDENVPFKKRVWINHLHSSNFLLLLFLKLSFYFISSRNVTRKVLNNGRVKNFAISVDIEVVILIAVIVV